MENPADADVAVVVAESGAAVREMFASSLDELKQPGVLWVAYPKGNKADINRDSLWPMLLD